VVWYRKDYFSARNIKQPTTWNEMTQAANALNDPANNKYGFLNYNLYPDQPPLEDLMITNNAVAVNKQGKVTIDSPATIGALNMIGELSKYSPPGSETTSQQAMRLPFGKGQGAMMITSTSVADVLAADPANAPLYGAFPIPINAGSRNGIIAVGAWWVTKNAEVDAAKRFLEFFFRDDTYTKFAQSTVIGHLPTLQPVASSSVYLNSPRIKPWASAIASASAVTSHGSLWAQELGLNTEAAPIGTARVANQMQDMLVISKQSAKAVASWGQNTATQAVEQSH
jgi:multiple sugar transport system substrate-binding protein